MQFNLISNALLSLKYIYRIRRCLVPPQNDRHFAKLGGGGLDKGDFYFPQIYIKN